MGIPFPGIGASFTEANSSSFRPAFGGRHSKANELAMEEGYYWISFLATIKSQKVIKNRAEYFLSLIAQIPSDRLIFQLD